MSDDLSQAPRALTIAGSDSGGGAGIQADLKTFSAYGVYGASAITAVTAQNTLGVTGWLAMPAALVEGQIDAVLTDIGAGAVKTGMLANAAIVRAVAAKMREQAVDNLVLDPVMIATSGDRLLEEAAVDALIHDLIPLALVVTPNVAEAEALTNRTIRSWDDVRGAAAQIVEMGARSVVITGADVAAAKPGSAIDLFYDGHAYRELAAIRVDTTSTHGTGCTFSSAIAAGLAKDMDLAGAVTLAKSYVTLAIQHAYPVGHGHGPVHHFFRYWQPIGPKYRPGVTPR
jgi:hydroxymethylpyrimidine kinase/phosphomethylpyrimidine kinase